MVHFCLDCGRNMWPKFMDNFSKQTTIHGLNIIGIPKLHILERLLWFVVVVSAIIGAIMLSLSNLRRFVANPTVVSLQKDYRNWRNPFPAVTCCSVHKTDTKKAYKLIEENWNINSSHEKFQYYMDFLQAVGNVSYDTLDTFNKYKDDSSLNNIDLVQLAVKMHPEIKGTLVTFDMNRESAWTMIMSEEGICFSVNSKFAKILRITGFNLTTDSFDNFLGCNYLNGLCYARFDSDPSMPLKYYVHSFLDVVHATIEQPFVVRESEELEINYRMQETGAESSLRDLSPSQRKCHFDDEPLLKEIPAYSTSLCYIGCRYKVALKLCGCKPFFYHFIEGKTCDIAGLSCLAQHAEYITQPPSELGCQCPQPCDLIIYLPQVPKSTKWEYGYFDKRITFRWGLLSPTTKFRREVLFSFEDLVVSFGGTLSLFLGMSFISLIETLFLITENCYRMHKQRKSGSNTINNIHLVHVYPISARRRIAICRYYASQHNFSLK